MFVWHLVCLICTTAHSSSTYFAFTTFITSDVFMCCAFFKIIFHQGSNSDSKCTMYAYDESYEYVAFLRCIVAQFSQSHSISNANGCFSFSSVCSSMFSSPSLRKEGHPSPAQIWPAKRPGCYWTLRYALFKTNDMWVMSETEKGKESTEAIKYKHY